MNDFFDTSYPNQPAENKTQLTLPFDCLGFSSSDELELSSELDLEIQQVVYIDVSM